MKLEPSQKIQSHISIGQAFEKFSPSYCNALPAFYAFAGSDYTASFKRKGKVKPFKVLEMSTKAQEVFA